MSILVGLWSQIIYAFGHVQHKTNWLVPCKRTWGGLSLATELPPFTTFNRSPPYQAQYHLKYPYVFGCCE